MASICGPCAHGRCSRQPTPPDAAPVRAKQWAEGCELEPAHEELGTFGHGVKEAADVGAQYGTPDMAVLSPSASCASNTPKALLMSPDQVAEPSRCMPAQP